MDEKVMVMEQDRLAKEKKRKQNRKKLGIASAVVLVVIAGGVWYLGWGRHLRDVQETTVKISTAPGQEIVYAGLTGVKGNEITYQVAQEATTDGNPSMGEEVLQDGGKSDGRGDPGGEMPQMPDTGERNGEMPERGEMQGGRMSGFGNGMTQAVEAMDAVAESFTYDGTVYELTGETVTTLIPVGTDVITKLGTVTTFSRLAAGDKVALVVEEDDGAQIITAVYIVG